jgi:hypothetical protein
MILLPSIALPQPVRQLIARIAITSKIAHVLLPFMEKIPLLI